VRKHPVILASLALQTLALAIGTCATGLAAETPAFYYQAVSMQELFARPAEVTSAERVQKAQALSFYRDVDLDGLKVSGFMASRKASAEPAMDYRTYLGLRYREAIANSVQLSGHTFYGAASYDGDNSYADPQGGALPEDVRAARKPIGEWLGSDWQLQKQLANGLALQAGLEYRQPVATHLLEDRHVFGSLATVEDPAAARRTVGLNAGSRIALAQNLAIDAQMHTGPDSAGYEVGLSGQPKGGVKAGVSYAVQQISDPLAAGSGSSLERRLARVQVAVPFFAERVSTAFELQHDAVAGALILHGRRDFVIGNVTLASGQLVRDTSLSVGVQNVFDIRGVNEASAPVPFLPADGRRLRLDLKRTF